MSVNVTLLQYSECAQTGSRIATFIWEYPRFIHAEVMTHRVFTRNAGSSRAIPVASMTATAAQRMCFPAEYRYNQSGMQPAEPMTPEDAAMARKIWEGTARNCIMSAERLNSLKLHKQWSNRMLEWFSPIRVLVTATEWSNFIWLRDHEDAQVEIRMVAEQTLKLLKDSRPMVISHEEWHVPFVTRQRNEDGKLLYVVDEQYVDAETAILVSQSCSAQISYRKENTSVEKAKELRTMFLDADRVHASPFEHQARPMSEDELSFSVFSDWPEGVTHIDRKLNSWSGNFKNFIQYRQTVKNHCYTESIY